MDETPVFYINKFLFYELVWSILLLRFVHQIGAVIGSCCDDITVFLLQSTLEYFYDGSLKCDKQAMSHA